MSLAFQRVHIVVDHGGRCSARSAADGDCRRLARTAPCGLPVWRTQARRPSGFRLIALRAEDGSIDSASMESRAASGPDGAANRPFVENT